MGILWPKFNDGFGPDYIEKLVILPVKRYVVQHCLSNRFVKFPWDFLCFTIYFKRGFPFPVHTAKSAFPGIEKGKGQLISKEIYGLPTSSKKQTNKFVFLSWRLGNTWNLNFDFKSSIRIEKKNLFVCFLEEFTAQQFCFEIDLPLVGTKGDKISEYSSIFRKFVFWLISQ